MGIHIYVYARIFVSASRALDSRDQQTHGTNPDFGQQTPEYTHTAEDNVQFISGGLPKQVKVNTS